MEKINCDLSCRCALIGHDIAGKRLFLNNLVGLPANYVHHSSIGIEIEKNF